MQSEDSNRPSKKQPPKFTLEQRKLFLIVRAAKKRFRRQWHARAKRLTARAQQIETEAFLRRLAAEYRQNRPPLPPDWRQQWACDDSGKPLPDVDNVVIVFSEDFYLSWRIVLSGGKLCHVWKDGDVPQVFTRADASDVLEYLAEIGLTGVKAKTLKEAMLIAAYNPAAPQSRELRK